MSCPDNSGVSVRRALAGDVGQIAAIEADTFSEPWSESSVALLVTEDFPSFVVEGADGRVLGYLSAQRALDELQIINVAVVKEYRGRGFGALLLRTAEEYCRRRGVSVISLEVRVSNLSAIALYRKQGFYEAGIRRNFYRHPTEDAAVMIKNLIL